MTLQVFCFYDCNDDVIGYKIGKKDGSKLENGRKYTTNKYMTKDEAFHKLQLAEMPGFHS